MFAMRCAVHQTLGFSPAALIFHRDMVLDIPIIANLEILRRKRQELIDGNLRRKNMSRKEHKHKIVDQILVRADDPHKLDPQTKVPFTITATHTNGTVSLTTAPHITQTINIRRIIPFQKNER